MKPHFQMFARYNRWANARLYAATAELSDEQYHRALGLFFGSVHATLNHLLLTDRMWLGRITGHDRVAMPLDTILLDDFVELSKARFAEDERIVTLIDGYSDAAFGERLSYRNSTGKAFDDPLGHILAHLFNHQTHHRGQAHSGLSILTGREPPALDLLLYQRQPG